MIFHKDQTGANLHEPKPHKDLHDPADGIDPLDTAAAAEIAGVQAAGEGSAHSYARSDHVHAVNHGITDNHLVTVDGASNQPVSGDYAKWTVNGLEGRSAAEVRSDINVEDGADVTDATNVDAAGAVMEADYDANTILAADADNTPTARTIGEDELVGRLSGGNIGAVTAAQARALVNLATITKTLTGTEAMAATVNVRAWYDPGGADREVDLPPEAAGVVEIVNTADADETLTVKDDSGISTIGIVGRYCAARFVCDGTTWRMLQLRYIAGDFEITGDLTVGGSVSAGLKVVTQAATDTLTAAECRGCVISNYGQAAENTQTLPAAAEGLHGLVVIGTAGAGAFHLKAGAGDKIYLDGKALDDGDKVSLATPAVGDNFTFFSFQTGASAYDWIVTSGSQGTLTDGGA